MKKVVIALLFGLCTLNLYSQWASNYWGYNEGDLNILNAKGMAVTTDRWDKCYVAGYVMTENGNDIVLIKYNNDGDTLWVRSFNGSGNSEDKAFGIVTDYEGDVYITGSVTTYDRGLELVLIKYKKNGNLLWAKTWGATNQMLDDEGLAVTLDNNDRICVTGYCTNGDGTSDILIQKYSPAGNLLFSKQFDGEDNLDSKGYGIAVNSNNAIYVAGYVTTSEAQEEIAVLKYNQNGNLVWSRIYEGSASSDKAFGIVVDESDNIYVTGYVSEDNSGSSTDAVLLKYNGAGTVKWERSYDGEGEVTEDKAWGIVVDEDNNSVYITGQTSTVSNELDYLTVRYTYGGVRRWVSKYNGTGNGDDYANAISLLPGNKVIVTGASWGTSGNHDYATVKINNNGNNYDVDRYSYAGNSDDIAKDVAVSKSHSNTVFVTGYSEIIIDGQNNQSTVSTVMLRDENNGNEVNTAVPDAFSLQQNYPNPFNPSTTIKFDLPDDVKVRLVIYDMLGKIVDILADQDMQAGIYTISYTNKNLASGVYFYELSAGDYRDVKKMTLIK